ncbi:hypothetical protein [Rubellicoccus peritrichatus]|uniref:Uncharacterized protein n=1 Tax=Rubellicoccus peritrichatus TaxID=3080537 RepID=A0AAQ3QWA7_9BACT|nr:hypothetical protein [Puniceicoccus sp. CR14]WOO42483.1 hypothetical protein RZN69_05230 [Puniceicoccus sp. CR14]
MSSNLLAENEDPKPVSFADDEEVRFDLNFPGGSAQELITAISSASGQPTNAIIPENGRSIHIPEFEVHNVTTFELLTSIHEMEQVWRQTSNSGHQINEIGYRWTPRAGPRASGIWFLEVISTPERPPNMIVKPVSIGDYLDNYSIDDISTAISLVWGTDAESTTKPDIKFHPETQLLIMRGTTTQIEGAFTVLQLLKEEIAKKAIKVGIYGYSIRYPGRYSFNHRPTLIEAFYRAGGVEGKNLPVQYEIFEKVDQDSKLVQEGNFSEIINDPGDDIIIEPFQTVWFDRQEGSNPIPTSRTRRIIPRSQRTSN